MPLPFDVTEATQKLSKADKHLAKLIRKAGPCTLDPETLHSPF